MNTAQTHEIVAGILCIICFFSFFLLLFCSYILLLHTNSFSIKSPASLTHTHMPFALASTSFALASSFNLPKRHTSNLKMSAFVEIVSAFSSFYLKNTNGKKEKKWETTSDGNNNKTEKQHQLTMSV